MAEGEQTALAGAARQVLSFDDNARLSMLMGEHDQNLVRLEQQLGVSFAARGNHISIEGGSDAVAAGAAALEALYRRLGKGLPLDEADIDAAARFALCGPKDVAAVKSAGGDSKVAALHDESLGIRTRKRLVMPRSPGQVAYLEALRRRSLVFGIGPAGTGKTYLAVAYGLSLLLAGRVERLILSRPAVEAGERLGFLPGDLKEKIDPYLRPLYDALHDMIPGEQVMNRLASGEIEVAPLAFMRGRTLSRAFVILDEAQNTTPVQMKMFLTRLGEQSHMAVTGDLSQIDLPRGQASGLAEACRVLSGVKDVAFVQFTDKDVVRHALVTRIVRAYDAWDRAKTEGEEAELFEPGGEG